MIRPDPIRSEHDNLGQNPNRHVGSADEDVITPPDPIRLQHDRALTQPDTHRHPRGDDVTPPQPARPQHDTARPARACTSALRTRTSSPPSDVETAPTRHPGPSLKTAAGPRGDGVITTHRLRSGPTRPARPDPNARRTGLRAEDVMSPPDPIRSEHDEPAPTRTPAAPAWVTTSSPHRIGSRPIATPRPNPNTRRTGLRATTSSIPPNPVRPQHDRARPKPNARGSASEARTSWPNRIRSGPRATTSAGAAVSRACNPGTSSRIRSALQNSLDPTRTRRHGAPGRPPVPPPRRTGPGARSAATPSSPDRIRSGHDATTRSRPTAELATEDEDVIAGPDPIRSARDNLRQNQHSRRHPHLKMS